ncbi:MAG: hypothetical protein ACETWQ_03185 [Phycisphaerae bacterium]
MGKKKEPAFGKRRPQISIEIERLHLDRHNPRLPADIQGKGEAEVLEALYRGFNLDEIAESMAQNGYFDEEPVVVIPEKIPSRLSKTTIASKDFIDFIQKPDTEFTVVEGNRRLAAIKILLDATQRVKLKIKHWPALRAEIIENLKVIPAIVYVRRNEVVPYLGVRHIVGIQKWDAYAKARYVASLVEGGTRLENVEAQIGDTQGSARKNYICYRMLEQAKEEFDLNPKPVEVNFSFIMLAFGQGKIKRFLGIPTSAKEINTKAPVPKNKLDNLNDLISWLYGDGQRRPVIKESRDITRYLTHVVESTEAVEHLRRTRDLEDAYELSGGEEQMVIRYLVLANKKLEGALGVIHRHKTSVDVIRQVDQIRETVQHLLETVGGKK